MSETDDTDDLLLIPPDLYTSGVELAETYCTAPYLTIVDSLITQVGKLEHRVNVEMDSRRKYASTDDLLTSRESYANTSSFSTPQKPRTKYCREEVTPKKHQRMLDDIERFISNIHPRNEPAGVRILYANPLDGSVNTDSALGDKSASASSSDSTQTTAFRNPNRLTVGSSESVEAGGSKLLSLSDLWGRNGRSNVNSLKEKVQEERLRRQHCEELIRELQIKVLELQEKVAVAVTVDEAKDSAISRFHDAWEQMTAQYKKLDSERESLECENRLLKEKNTADVQEYAKKLEQNEAELATALGLARTSQEKLMNFETQNTELNAQLSNLEASLKRVESRHVEEAEKNRRVNEILAQKEMEIIEHKNVLSESRKEVCQCKEAIELCQKEFTQMKNQYTQLELILDAKQSQIKELEMQKRNISNDNENLKVIQRNLQEEMIRLRESTEKTKVELRNFYQDQVEIVVRDKLREFQAQLDKTETSLQNEIKSREMNIAKTAAGHIHQLTEKHSLEVNLLEEKHREEVKLYQVQLTQSQQQVEQMRVKLKKLTEARTTVLQQLRRVMEAQWAEALKIVNDGKSPVNLHNGTIDRLHNLKTKSYSNLEEVLSDNKLDDHDEARSSVSEDFKCLETPVTSKSCKGRQQIENDLQNYVQMLLSKQTQNGDYGDRGNRSDNSSEEKLLPDDFRSKTQSSSQFRKGMKPPWK